LLRELLQGYLFAAWSAALEMSLKLVFYIVRKKSVNRTASMLPDIGTIHRSTSKNQITMNSFILPNHL
jgi:hypothetical protein